MKLTVYYDGQFWVGVLEMLQDGRLKAARHLFGTEPKDAELLDFVQREAMGVLERVKTGVMAETAIRPARPISPKRMIRQAQKEIAATGLTSKAQAALQQELASRKKERAMLSKEQREQHAAYKRDLARQKAKAKHRGR